MVNYKLCMALKILQKHDNQFLKLNIFDKEISWLMALPEFQKILTHKRQKYKDEPTFRKQLKTEINATIRGVGAYRSLFEIADEKGVRLKDEYSFLFGMNLEEKTKEANAIRQENDLKISEVKEKLGEAAEKLEESMDEGQLNIDGEIYQAIKFKKERDDFDKVVKENYKVIFGEDSIYIDLEAAIKAGRNKDFKKCDGFVLEPDKKMLYIVENELYGHDVFEHIIPQMASFLLDTKDADIRATLNRELKKYNKEKKLGIDYNKIDFLEIFESEDYEITMIINNFDTEIENVGKACKNLVRGLSKEKKQTKIKMSIFEFKVFQNDTGKRLFFVRKILV